MSRPEEDRVIAQLVVEDSSPWQHIPKDLTEVASVGSKVCQCVRNASF